MRDDVRKVGILLRAGGDTALQLGTVTRNAMETGINSIIAVKNTRHEKITLYQTLFYATA
jgi:hypothetical protein